MLDHSIVILLYFCCFFLSVYQGLFDFCFIYVILLMVIYLITLIFNLALLQETYGRICAINKIIIKILMVCFHQKDIKTNKKYLNYLL